MKRLVVALTIVFAGARTQYAATFTVTNANDSGPGSLRQAILDANATTESDQIVSASSSDLRVNLVSPLPAIDAPLLLLPTGQSITLDGRSLIDNTPALRVTSSNVTLQRLTIVNFVGDGIRVTDAGERTMIDSCSLGVEKDGTVGPIGGDAISIERSTGVSVSVVTQNVRRGIHAVDSSSLSISGSNISLSREDGVVFERVRSALVGRVPSSCPIGECAFPPPNKIQKNGGVGLRVSDSSLVYIGANDIGSRLDASLGNAQGGIAATNTTGSVERTSLWNNGGPGIRYFGALYISYISTGKNVGGGIVTNAPLAPKIQLRRVQVNSSTTWVEGELQGAPNEDYEVGFYRVSGCESAAQGEGNDVLNDLRTWVETDSAGRASLSFAGPPVASAIGITALATLDAPLPPTRRATSQFSPCVVSSIDQASRSDVEVSQTLHPALPLVTGRGVEQIITVTNHGPSATRVSVDTSATGLKRLSFWCCETRLRPGESVTRSVYYAVDGSIGNVTSLGVTVGSEITDPTTSNNSAMTQGLVESGDAPTVDLSIGDLSIPPGTSPAVIDFSVTNRSPQEIASGIQVSTSATNGWSAGTSFCHPEILPAGAVTRCQARAYWWGTAPAPSTVITISVGASQRDSAPTDNRVQLAVTPAPAPVPLAGGWALLALTFTLIGVAFRRIF